MNCLSFYSINWLNYIFLMFLLIKMKLLE